MWRDRRSRCGGSRGDLSWTLAWCQRRRGAALLVAVDLTQQLCQFFCLAVLHWVDGRFVLEAVAPGFTAEDIVALTEMEFAVAPRLEIMDTA